MLSKTVNVDKFCEKFLIILYKILQNYNYSYENIFKISSKFYKYLYKIYINLYYKLSAKFSKIS